MILEESITRDCAFDTNKEGKHYFSIKEGERLIFQSDLYDSLDDCTKDGINMMDMLHEKTPLLCESRGFYNGATAVRKKGEFRG